MGGADGGRVAEGRGAFIYVTEGRLQVNGTKLTAKEQARISGEHRFTLTPEGGGTRLEQSETYRGLLGRMSAKSISRTKASFEALNQAIKERAEHEQQATPE